MSEKIESLFVVFESDVGEEYANRVVEAIKLFKGVLEVSINVVNFDNYVERSRIRNEMINTLLKKK